MLLSMRGPGMAVGASAVWVRDAGCSQPPQLRAGMCPPGVSPHWGQEGPSPGPGRARDRMHCALPFCPQHPHRSSPSPLLQQGIPPAPLPAIALVHFTHFSGGWGLQPLGPVLPVSCSGSSSSVGLQSSCRVLREGAALPVWQRVSMATALSFPQRFSRQLATGVTC